MGDIEGGRKDGAGEKKLGLSTKILVGLVAGIACGLFFGEYCGWLAVIGEGFVDLLQMTVLPYITAALILNIGRLTADEARKLAGRAGLVLLLLWAVAIVALVAAPHAFPTFKQGAFFSVDLIQQPAEFNPLDIYIPENPFYSLANNIVPAVVLFSICLGVALIGIERKQGVLDMLDVVCQALTRVNGFVVRLTPYGIFAIAAAAAGTMTLEELDRLRAYLLVYTASGVVLAFWVVPMLVTALTPFSYRQVVGVSRDAVMTAFATGKLFVVLPLLIDASHRLFEELEFEEATAGDTASVLVPLAYPFPSIGKMLGLLFIPFTAWFVGGPLVSQQYPMLIGAGLLSFFGSPLAAVPYLLDLFRLPADMFNLFMVSGVWATRVSDAVGAMHLLAFSVLGTCAMAGLLRFQPRRLTAAAVSSIIIAVVAVVGIRGHLGVQLQSMAASADAIERMDLRRDPAPHTVLEEAAPNPVPLADGQRRLERIRETGTIRVGFNPDQLPFAFFNADGDLVGYDVEMAHRLAQELGVAVHFVPYDLTTLPDQLVEDHFDVAMSGMVATFRDLERMVLAFSGLELTGALVVPDHLREMVASVAAIREFTDLKLCLIGDAWISARFHQRLPSVQVVEVADHAEFFERDHDENMALVTTAEAGAAWTLRYPEYHVVVPGGVDVKAELVYPIGGRDPLFRSYIERWARLAGDNGTVRELFDYWILGHGAVQHQPRWSVIRDVLHWVE